MHKRVIVLYLSALLLFLSFNLSAKSSEPDALPDSVKIWKYTGSTSLSFSQNSLSNWAEGGENSLAGTAYVVLNATKSTTHLLVDHQLNLAYGIMQLEGKKLRKTDDKLELFSSFGIKSSGSWQYTSQINFKTQFSDGFKYPDDSTVISTFMAPGYLTASIGIQYKKWEDFTLFLSPASGKFTFVLDQTLANQGAFGVTKATLDTAGKIIQEGRNIKPEFGININARFKKELFKNVNVDSRLQLYNNYLDENQKNRWNIDLNFETMINFQINKFLSSTIRFQVIYDHNIMIPRYDTSNDIKTKIGEGPGTQIKQSLGIGLSYKF